MTARLSVVAICVALLALGAYVGTVLLVGMLSLAMIGLTIFESLAAVRSAGGEADTPEA